MNTIIYYFTGSGNSLFIARKIARKTKAKTISIPSVMNKQSIQPDAEAIGIVFPVYYATNDKGIPLIIERFINKLKGISYKYVFAVCTSAYLPGETMENLSKMIKMRNGELSAGFVINMSNRTFFDEIKRKMNKDTKSENIGLSMSEKKQEKINNKLSLIADTVDNHRKVKLETRSLIGKIMYAPLLALSKVAFTKRYMKLAGVSHRLPFRELIPLADNSYKVNESCNSCGICANICPVNNIKMVNGIPVWLHHCETCQACYQWCPQEAIYGKIVEHDERYHHPEVKLADMLMDKG